ncbi:MAG: hypothetical protein JWN15_1059 [Firmicutes bacterium]|nr:hypothetical protein [Bacillota bacterium]
MVKEERLGSHAVVIGGSMAGLLAARVLANRFERVTVIERDELKNEPVVRKGAPQANHAHALMIRGQQIMERLFPGLTQDLIAAGADYSDSARDSRWYQHGVIKGRFDSGLMALSMSRALLEWQVRTHLLRLPNVQLVSGLRVTGLVTDASRTAVTGINVQPVQGGLPETLLAADLVVDASGRGTRTPGWLQELGYGEVPVTELKLDVAYASRIFHWPASRPDWHLRLQFEERPSTRICVMLPLEGNRWLVTLQTMFGDACPTDEAGFMAFIRDLSEPDIHEVLSRCEPEGPIMAYRIPSSLRRHYERMARFPEGLMVLGDAACSFNPRYGQGMTTAAMGAEALEQALLEQGNGRLEGLSRRFQQRLAKVIELPWQAGTSEDLAYPEAEGARPVGAGLINWYMRRMIRLGSRDREAAISFLRVLHLLRPISEVFRPRVLLRVLTGL